MESSRRDYVPPIRNHAWRSCPRRSGTKNQHGGTSSVRYVVARLEGTSSSIRCEESSMWDFVRPVRSHTKGGLVLVRSVREIKLARLRPFGTKSCERRACPHTSGTRNRAGYTSSIQYEVTRKESLSSSLRYDVTRKESFSSFVQYEESRRWEFVHPVRSSVKGELVLVRPERGIKQARHRPSGTKTCERRACPHPSGTRNQAGCTLSVQYEVKRTEGLSSSVRYEESHRLDFVCLV